LGMIKHNVLSENDAVSVVAAKPLTVFDGSVDVNTVTVDQWGEPVRQLTHVGIAPDGSETDLSIGYSRRLEDGTSLSLALGGQIDAGNVSGQDGGTARLRIDVP